MRNRFICLTIVAAAVLVGQRLFVSHSVRPSAAPALSAEAVARIEPPANGQPLPVLWDAPAFSYADQNGRPFSSRDLRGHVWIADFFFTDCGTVCPVMTASMSTLARTISNRAVEFVSFSIDPGHDTPAVLNEYAKRWKADDARWHFLSTKPDELAETVAGMRTFVTPPTPDAPLQHSSIFILVDGDCKVRGAYDSGDPGALDVLADDAAILAGDPPRAGRTAWPRSKAADLQGAGAVLYASLGCAACHAQQRVAPSLAGCFGRSVRLDDGRVVASDENYIRESILDPNAKVVAGYARLMPSYRGRVTDWDLDQLIDYIKSMSSGCAATHAPARAASTTLPLTREMLD